MKKILKKYWPLILGMAFIIYYNFITWGINWLPGKSGIMTTEGFIIRSTAILLLVYGNIKK